MGNTDSSIPGDGYSGYHVLKVEEYSPGFKAGLQSYFDYIVAINGIPLDQEADSIVKILQDNQDKEVKLTVYSSKTKQCRNLQLFLDSRWGGSGLLGASIRFCAFEGANENVWHVLDVQSRSPADLAGLKSNTDYIIGADSILNCRDDFFDLIESHDNMPTKLYVYSSLTDKCREVHLTPNSNWGGQGMLGCDIGYGYLHRIPVGHINDVGTDNDLSTENGIPSQSPPDYQSSIKNESIENSYGGIADCPHENENSVTTSKVEPIPDSYPTVSSQLYLSTETHTTPSMYLPPTSFCPSLSSLPPPNLQTQSPLPNPTESQAYVNVPRTNNNENQLPPVSMMHQANLALPGMPPLNVPLSYNNFPIYPGMPQGAENIQTVPFYPPPQTMGMPMPMNMPMHMSTYGLQNNPDIYMSPQMHPSYYMNQQGPPLPPFNGTPFAVPSASSYTEPA